ncbi:CtsR family transcriptional regulator [Clostridium sp. NSJ-49]|jgi:transcriptional regulator CtsR|uniref:Transcriptional regulator CtsR n=1 Tax=Clostridium disporicum TaxID=84024 RepID=A0A174IHC8_9CLOT|nr:MULTISPECIES: CtsR family transcriptional regulator [Clostridium]MBC5624538.1 CtsR family transcriptional regulator [Clostridium sp. NSJ-49]MCD2501781.1 CtsR family transcriptional regulator [Clostridium sp. NSJ-145]CUO85881.1 transcriptional repressor CtsR [Clostridium disporicum]
MARISDGIAEFLNNMIEEKTSKEIIIQRNDLADKFNCAPSQINYVLTTRFSHEKGYIIESRRGGGGYIVIKKISNDNNEKIAMMLNEAIGKSITYQGALSLINYLLELNLVTERECDLIKMSVNDRILTSVEDKNKVRADILRGMIAVILS